MELYCTHTLLFPIAIEEIPTNMQFCRSLLVLELSSNPLLRSVVHVYMYIHMLHVHIMRLHVYSTLANLVAEKEKKSSPIYMYMSYAQTLGIGDLGAHNWWLHVHVHCRFNSPHLPSCLKLICIRIVCIYMYIRTTLLTEHLMHYHRCPPSLNSFSMMSASLHYPVILES